MKIAKKIGTSANTISLYAACEGNVIFKNFKFKGLDRLLIE
jgi:hypothetical protein